MSTIRFLFKADDVLTDATSVVLSDSTGTYGVKRDDTDAVVVADGTAMTKSATGTYTHTWDDPSGFTDSTYTYAVEAVYGGETYRWQYTMDGPTAAGILAADSDLARFDPSVTRLLDGDYSQSDFGDQRAEALTWLYRVIDLHNPNGVDQSEEDRDDGYLLEKEELERAAAYYCLYLVYEQAIKEAGDAFDIKAAHWKDRAYTTMDGALVEFDTAGDGDTTYSYKISSKRLGRG